MVLGKLILVSAVIAGVAIYLRLSKPLPNAPPLPEGYFGKKLLKDGEAIPKDNPKLNKFTVKVPESVIEDLQSRINSSRFVEPLPDAQFHYGFNGNYLRKVVEYWQTTYDWRKQEKELNKYEQFTTEIEGISVHFVKVKPVKTAKHVFPLLLLHGWPGSVIEFYKMIPLLTTPKDDVVFEVIVPSIPGYGFSEAPHQQGFNCQAAARIFKKLMDRLGYNKFYIHGGDWGAMIGTHLSEHYGDNVLGFHTTMGGVKLQGLTALKFVVGMFVPSLVFDDPQADYDKLYPFSEKFSFILRESGYMHIQSTKPDTIGAALINTPVGLAAYILEKFSTWTSKRYIAFEDGKLTDKYTLDELLTNIMIYWISPGTVTSSVRFYKENVGLLANEIEDYSVHVPTAFSQHPYELMAWPKSILKTRFLNIVQYTEQKVGGHFAAFEEPQLINDDIRSFIKKTIDQPSEKKASTP